MAGSNGSNGSAGPGLATGGAARAALRKTSAADYATEFYTPALSLRDGAVYHTSPLPRGTIGVATASGVAYWVYVGTIDQLLPTTCFVNFLVTTLAAGAQTAAVCLASTPVAPNRTPQTLTVRAFNATLTTLTSTGMKRNTVAMSGQVTGLEADAHLWLGIRTAMATTQPTIGPWLVQDEGRGAVLTTPAAAVFAVGSTYTGITVTPAVNSNHAPALGLSFT